MTNDNLSLVITDKIPIILIRNSFLVLCTLNLAGGPTKLDFSSFFQCFQHRHKFKKDLWRASKFAAAVESSYLDCIRIPTH